MFLSSLFDRVLVEPQRQGATSLFVVSGYASATFASRHLSQIEGFSLNLIVGMPGNRADHKGWLGLEERYGHRLTVHYIECSPYVHCKAYGWFRDGQSHSGFSGSANYTQTGFLGGGQINQMVSHNPDSVKDLYESLVPRAIQIRDFEISAPAEYLMDLNTLSARVSAMPGGIEWIIPEKAVKISFLAKDGTMPAISGLNWGQRPGRHPDQAELRLRKEARKKGFLPQEGLTFTLITDDNEAIDCKVGQQNRKAIMSTYDNSIIGKYIRKRLGVPSGSFVTKEDLIRYGRTDFTLVKIDEETVLFDFSVPENT